MDHGTTNRDLYGFIEELVEQRAEYPCTLQHYLENLRRIGHGWRGRDAISLGEFVELLRAAFAAAPSGPDAASPATEGYLAWDSRIGEQIRDLDEMRQQGILADARRGFGVDAPGGGRWYNFEPCTYLECAAEGTFGGWDDDDDNEEPTVVLPPITWARFVDFLNAGQWYE